MKKVLYTVISVVFLLFNFNCKSDSGGTTTDPFGGGGTGGGGGGGNTGNVTFTMAVAQQQQSGDYYFQFTPSTNVVVNTVRGQCAALNVDQTVNDNGTDVYGPNTPFYIGPIQDLQHGVQWTFTVTGKIGNAQGQAYTSNFNWTVP